MTKQEIEARVKLVENLYREAEKVLEPIRTLIPGAILDNNLHSLKKYINIMSTSPSLELDEDDVAPISYPEITINPELPHIITISSDIGNGDKLFSATAISDYGTLQANTGYATNEGDIVDLTLSEVKRGELAKIHGYTEDNDIIDTYVYEDVFTEDYTKSFSIKPNDIKAALSIEDEKDIDI
jgi:hypothetical protein